MRCGEQGQGEAIGGVSFEHEVDAEKQSRENIEQMGEPVGKRRHEITGRRCQRAFRTPGDVIDSQTVGDRELVDARHHLRNAGRKVSRELVEVVKDRRKADRQKDTDDEGHAGDEQKDRGRF